MSSTNTDPLAGLKANGLAIAAKPLLDALASLQANPTVLNAAAQGVALQGAFVGALPALETLGIKDVATLLHAKITEALASAAAPAIVPPAASTANQPT